MAEFIVDVQGFKKPDNKFVFKELVIISLGEDTQPTVYFFEPPYSYNILPVKYRCENGWLKRNFHGLHWDDGEIPYGDLEDVFQKSIAHAGKIFVKGVEKKSWIQEIISNPVTNLEDIGCPSLSKLYNLTKFKPCSYHDQFVCDKPVCAVKNVIVLKKWLLDYYNTPVLKMYKEIDTSNVGIPTLYDDKNEISDSLKKFFENFKYD